MWETQSRDRIIDIPVIEGIAAQKTPQGEQAALPCPILANCFQGVGTAGRPEPASGRKIGRNIALIEGNEGK